MAKFHVIWNVACDGRPVWDGTVAIITADKD
jgi:hypothetical protein